MSAAVHAAVIDETSVCPAVALTIASEPDERTVLEVPPLLSDPVLRTSQVVAISGSGREDHEPAELGAGARRGRIASADRGSHRQPGHRDRHRRRRRVVDARADRRAEEVLAAADLEVLAVHQTGG